MRTEKIAITIKGEQIAECEIERFEAGDDVAQVWLTICEIFATETDAFAWLNKVYEIEVVRQAKKAARTPKIPKELLPKLRKRLQTDGRFLEYCAKKLGVELE